VLVRRHIFAATPLKLVDAYVKYATKVTANANQTHERREMNCIDFRSNSSKIPA
jgi:hypothetical protein